MAQINLTPTNSGGHTAVRVTVNYTETNVNTANNTSDVYFDVILSRNSWTTSWYGQGQKIYVTVTINGVANTVYIPRYNYSGKNLPGSTFGSGTVTGIAHNNDGSKTINISASITDKAKESYTSGSASASSTMALTNIPRASSFDFSGTTLNSPTTVNIYRASSSFTHTVVYTMGGVSQSYGNIATSTSFTRPYSDANQFGANSASGTGTITVITYNGGAEIGRTSKNIVMTLPDNDDTRPVANTSTAITDSISAIAQKFGVFVQSNSRLLFTFDYSGRYGASIREYSVTIDNNIYTGNSNTVTTNTINQSGSVNYTCKIKDTRGRTTTETGIVSISAYIKPQISAIIERNNTGQSANVHINASITSLNNLNDKLVTVKYKPHTSEAYYSLTVPFDENSYVMDKTVQIPISESLSYDFYVTSADFFSTEATPIIPISTVFDLMHFGADGESIAIGKRVEISKAFEIGLDLYYKGMSIDDYIRQIINEERNDV